MTPNQQLQLWVDGKPVHNNNRYINGIKMNGGECCPDFSCCYPELLAPTDVRQQFAKASEIERNGMLMDFLTKLLESRGFDVETLE